MTLTDNDEEIIWVDSSLPTYEQVSAALADAEHRLARQEDQLRRYAENDDDRLEAAPLGQRVTQGLTTVVELMQSVLGFVVNMFDIPTQILFIRTRALSFNERLLASFNLFMLLAFAYAFYVLILPYIAMCGDNSKDLKVDGDWYSKK